MGMMAPEGAPPPVDMSAFMPAQPPPQAPQQGQPDFFGLLKDLIQGAKALHDVAPDEQAANEAARVLASLQKLLAVEEKQTESALGISPQMKMAARAVG